MANELIASEERKKIKNYISKLQSSDSNCEQIDKSFVNRVLDELCILGGSSPSIPEKFDCIRLCCVASDGVLLGKCSQVLMKFVQNERLTDSMVSFTLDWCLKSVNKAPDIAQTEILAILQYLIVHRGSTCRQNIGDILRTLKNPLEDKTKLVCPGEILILKLNCIRESIPLMSYAHYAVVKDILIQIIGKNLSVENALKAKMILLELDILTLICEKNITWLSENIGVTLGICLCFASYGLPHHTESVPQYMLPTPLLVENRGDKSAASKSKKKRKPKKNLEQKIQSTPLDDITLPELNWSQTSESDFSDSEMGRLASTKKSERKNRLNSISLLLFVVKNIEKKELIGYWPNILSGPYSILKTLSADSSPRSRVAISSILSILFSSGKLFLSQAQHPTKTANLPYVTWSHLLADLIESTHKELCSVVAQSQSVGCTLSILQCLAIFLCNTPYHRMNTGILKAVVQALNPLLKHTDSNVRLAAIKCLTEIVVLECTTEEQIALLCSNNCDENSNSEQKSWTVCYCLESIENESLSVTIRAECWLLLGNLIKHHFSNIHYNCYLIEILDLIRRDIEDSNVVLQQKSAKAFELMVIPLNSLDESGEFDMYHVWLSMIEGPLVPMLQSTSGILASAAADCISNISPHLFEKFPERVRIFVMTTLCGCVAHEDHVARSAAVRSLGTIVLFPFVSQNIQIIYDVADRIVCAIKDENLNVRSKAAWALGNLSDVLVDGKQTGIPIEEVPLLNVLEHAVATGDDRERVREFNVFTHPPDNRVKAYTMRAIGNLLLLFDEAHLEIEKFQRLTEDAVITLAKNALNDSNMKVRWNACYSLGNMLKNVVLLRRITTNWQMNVFDALSKLIVSCSNFKVRKSAANALSVITIRDYYGDRIKIILPALLKALENSQNLPEFSEYKHQQNLIDQLCSTLCHFCLLLHLEDFANLPPSLIAEQVESFKLHVASLKQRNPELISRFNDAVKHLRELCGSGSNPSEETTINMLIEVLEYSKIEPIEDCDPCS